MHRYKSLLSFNKNSNSIKTPVQEYTFLLKGYLPLIIARVALNAVQDSPTESRRDLAIPFEVPALAYTKMQL